MIRNTSRVILAAVLVAGCSRGDSSADRTAQSAQQVAAPQAAATPTPDTAGEHAAHGMAGMDHSQMAGAGSPGAPGGAQMDHSAHTGMQHGAGTSTGPAVDHGRMPGMDHRGTGGMQHQAGGAGAQRTDHTQMQHARTQGGQQGQMQHGRTQAAGGGHAGHGATPARTTAMNHANMPGMQHGTATGTHGVQHGGASTPRHEGMQHGAAAPGAPRMDHSRMQGMDHSRMGAGTTQGAPRAQADDAGMEKLRMLVAELVQDSVIQARIQANPELRRRWENEGVRRVLLNPAQQPGPAITQPNPHAGHGRP